MKINSVNVELTPDEFKMISDSIDRSMEYDDEYDIFSEEGRVAMENLLDFFKMLKV